MISYFPLKHPTVDFFHREVQKTIELGEITRTDTLRPLLILLPSFKESVGFQGR